MKIFRFVKKVFLIGLTILSDIINANSLSCISMNNQECKTRSHHKLLMLMQMNLFFFHLVLKQVNAVVVVIILTIYMQKFVFLLI